MKYVRLKGFTKMKRLKIETNPKIEQIVLEGCTERMRIIEYEHASEWLKCFELYAESQVSCREILEKA